MVPIYGGRLADSRPRKSVLTVGSRGQPFSGSSAVKSFITSTSTLSAGGACASTRRAVAWHNASWIWGKVRGRELLL